MINNEVQLTSDVNNQYPEFVGTPTFIINGKMLKDTANWAALRAAAGRSAEVRRFAIAFAACCHAAGQRQCGSEQTLRRRTGAATGRDRGRHARRRFPDGQSGRAKVKLIEYGSLACPHCRHFEETGYKPLVQGYVRPGHVSYEFRNLLLNAPDISVSLLAHCAGPAKFFPMAQVVYATQPQWFEKVYGLARLRRARSWTR